jgi:DNA-binding transcriptional MerR regulator
MAMRFGTVSPPRESGVSVRALRYYEERGLLVPERSDGGHRHYPESGVDLVWLIQRCYAAGLSSRTILAILPCVETGETTPEALALLVAERERIDRRMTELAGARDRLDTVIASASSCSHARPA